ncbi:sulfotransferase [Sorangium sp. So ce216]
MLPQHALLARLLNSVGRLAPKKTFEFEELKKLAVRRAGSDSWDDIGEFDEALKWVLDEASKLDTLTFLGRQWVKNVMLGALTKRLEVERYRREHAITTDSPRVGVIIVSPPRTGTTLLFELLDATGLFRSPMVWELIFAGSSLSPAKRKSRAVWMVRMQSALTRLDDLHPVDALGPEECTMLLNYTGICLSYDFVLGLPEARRRLAELDPLGRHARRRYDHHALLLNTIAHERLASGVGAERDQRPWLLKAPGHAEFVGAVAAKYPEASLVVNLRSPSDFVPSVCSLQMAHQQPFVRTTPANIAEHSMKILDHSYSTLGRWSANQPGKLRLVEYDDLVQEPLTVARKVLEASGVPHGEADLKRAEDWLKSRKRRPSVLRSTLDDYGLDAETVNSRLAPAMTRIRETGLKISSVSSPAPRA